MLRLVPTLKQQLNELINGKCQANKDQKSNLLFLQRHNRSQKFQTKLAKNRQKNIAKTLQYTLQTSQDTLQLEKTGDCENIHSVNPLYLLVNHASGYIEEKKWK